MNAVPEKMRAIVAYAPGDYRLEKVDTPKTPSLKVEIRSARWTKSWTKKWSL